MLKTKPVALLSMKDQDLQRPKLFTRPWVPGLARWSAQRDIIGV